MGAFPFHGIQIEHFLEEINEILVGVESSERQILLEEFVEEEAVEVVGYVLLELDYF